MLKCSKMSFRILSILIVLIIFTVSVSFAAIPNDVKNTDYEEAVTLLTTLGILKGYSDGSFNPDATITRAEFAVIVTRILGLNEIKSNSNEMKRFDDVTSEHWAFDSIRTAFDLGIINGYSDGTFAPSETVTYEQAVKMLIVALGYGYYAEQKGGYPTGYLVLASQNGLIKNIQGEMNQPVKRGIVTKLVFNALDIDLMMQTSFGDESQNYSVVKDKNLLTEYLHITKKTGIVTANSETNIYGNALPRDGEVAIDRIYYKVGNTNASELIGNNVVYYFKTESNEEDKELVVIIPNKDKNEIITVNADDISDDTTKTELRYWENKDKDKSAKTLKIATNATIVYNGRYYSDIRNISDNELRIESGMIKFIDNNINGEYDVLIITEYKNFVVDRVSSNRVYFKYGQTYLGQDFIELDLDNNDYIFDIIIDGKRKSISDFVNYDVIGIAKSKDNKLIKIVSEFKTLSGKIDEIGSNEESIYIDGKEYDVSQSYHDSPDREPFEIGDTRTFRLDLDKKIAAVEMPDKEKKNYAYLQKVATEGGLDGVTKFKIYKSDGKWVTLTGAKKITIFSSVYQDGTKFDAKDILAKINIEGSPAQLIMYELNDKGELSKLYTYNDQTVNNPMILPKYPFKKQYTTNGDTRIYMEIVGGLYKLTTKTIFLKIPNDASIDEAYTIGNFYDYYGDVIAKQKLEVYNANDINIPDIVIERAPSESSVSPGSHCAIFDKSVFAINSDGYAVNKIYFYQGGKYLNKEIKDNNLETPHDDYWLSGRFSDLRKGDLFQYSVDDLDRIKGFRFVFDVSNPGSFKTLVNEFPSGVTNPVKPIQITGTTYMYTTYGRVSNIKSNYLLVNSDPDGNNNLDYNKSFYMLDAPSGTYMTYYFMYDSANQTVKQIKRSEIDKGDTVFVHESYYRPMLIYIIR